MLFLQGKEILVMIHYRGHKYPVSFISS